MPIILPSGLPAAAVLAAEGHAVFHQARGDRVRVAVLNLMPDRIRAETQIARQLGHATLDVEIVLARLAGRDPRHQPDHVRRFYAPAQEVLASGVDALVVTGAPVERMPFESVDYWHELRSILELSGDMGLHRLFICWAAQAALHAAWGVAKRDLASKAFGVYTQTVTSASDLVTGLGARFLVPVSRHTSVRACDLRSCGVSILAGSRETGPALAESPDGLSVYSFNHFEYDAYALQDEYRRDLAAGLRIALPRFYFPGDDPGRAPLPRWTEAAATFFRNWTRRIAAARDGARAKPSAEACDPTFAPLLSMHAQTFAPTARGDGCPAWPTGATR